MKLILGKKLAMTQIFKDDGAVIPVTAVLATPNVITQIKSAAGKDGYDAVQIGYGETRKNGKSKSGHLKGLAALRTLKEFRVAAEDVSSLKRGDEVTVSVFAPGDEVKVTGTSKGKGFQGVVKRHKFHGAPKSHGHKDQERMPGSIGAGGVQRVFKGKRMAGHMGDEQVTVSGLSVVAVDAEKNIVYIKGAVPGARNGAVMIYGPGIMEIKAAAPVTEEAAVEEEKIETAAPVQEEKPGEAVAEAAVIDEPVAAEPAEPVKE